MTTRTIENIRLCTIKEDQPDHAAIWRAKLGTYALVLIFLGQLYLAVRYFNN